MSNLNGLYTDIHEPYIPGFCFCLDSLRGDIEKHYHLNPYHLQPIQLANALSSAATIERIEIVDAILGGIGTL